MSWTRFLLTVVLVALPMMTAAADVEVHSKDTIPYISGGVGDEDLKSIEAMGQQYNLKLTMALASGHFVGDTTVRIQDAKGQSVLDAVSNGPLFFAKLPPGTYAVSCSLGGKEQKQTAHVTAGNQAQLQFTWSSE